MKPILLLILLSAPLRAELLATFQTTRGDVIVSLQYDKAPQTVANFITLAQGTRARIDPFSGAVIRKPLYVGENFFRVESNDFTKIAQTGSGAGTNNGGPGYTFRDEFDASLKHVPYVLSMANSGEPHTNGSQIFLTGNITVLEYDNSYTIFGLVTDGASRGVIDSIIAAGANGTTINNVIFNRTSPGAMAFDEHAQKLPVCSAIPGGLEVVPGQSVIYQLAAPQPGGSLFRVIRSQDLQSWSFAGDLYQGVGLPGAGRIIIDDASVPRAFYNLGLVTYPDALAPASLANRTLVVGLLVNHTLTYRFDGTGHGGTVTFSGDDLGPTPIAGVAYTPYPYKATWIIESLAYLPFRFEGTLNTENASFILGSNTSEVYREPVDQSPRWDILSRGTLTLSK